MSFLSLPLLFLLHGLYLIYASLPPNPFKRSAQPSTPPAKPRRAPPRHVALLLVSPANKICGAGVGLPSPGHQESDVQSAMMECIERAVAWAEEEGVEEVTIFEGGTNRESTRHHWTTSCLSRSSRISMSGPGLASAGSRMDRGR